jgi:O-antigen/teichoic acid export membrane protein
MKLPEIRLDAGVYWNLLGGALPAVIALLCTGLMAWLLSSEHFLVISLMLSVCLFLQVYDFGFSRTLHYFQRYFDSDAVENQFVTTSLGLGLLVGAIITSLAWLFVPFFVENWLARTMKTLPFDEVIQGFQIVALSILPSILMQVYRGIMEARGAFKAVNTGKIIAVLSLFLATLLSAWVSESLVIVALTILLTRILSLWIYAHLAGMTATQHFVVRLFDMNTAKRLISHTSLAAVSGAISAGFIYGDRFFVSGFIDAYDYMVYALSQDFLSRFLLVPWSLAMILVPVLASQTGLAEQLTQIKRTYVQSFYISISFVAFAIIVILWALPFFVSQASLVTAQNSALVILAGVFFGAFAQIPMVGLYALGKVKVLCLIFGFELFAYLCIAPWCLNEWGLSAAVIIWTGRLMLEAVLLNYFFLKAMSQS